MKQQGRIGTILCTAALAALCFVGCAEDSPKSRSPISYVAVESEVYSSTAEVVQAVADSVVEISTESVTTQFGMQYIVSGAGSGVIVGQRGDTYLIVTNNHVIEGANEITVRTRSAETSFTASLVATDDSVDIAVVEITSKEALTLAVWGDSDALQVGETVIAIGNPLGNLGGTVTQGILSATGRTIVVEDFPMTLLQTDAAINPGNSGGGLFNLRGQLIGVVNAKSTSEGIEGLCFAIPANSARAAFGTLTEYGYLVGRATLDLELAEGTLSVGGQAQSIVYLTAVGKNADSNFKQYDRLAEINGRKITSILDYNAAMAELRPGDSVTVKVYRGSVTQGFFGGTLSFDTSPTTFSAVAAQYGA